MKDVTIENYIKSKNPGPGLCLIEKDLGAAKLGSNLWMPKDVSDRSSRLAPTGIIRKLSAHKFYQEPWDKHLHEYYKVGMHVSFDMTTPYSAPWPPYYRPFREKPGASERSLVLINLADIIGDFNFEELSG